MNDQSVTAHHEAGHALVAVLVGLTPALVSVRPRPGTLGRLHHSSQAKQIAAAGVDDPDVLERFGMVALAGPLAQASLDPNWRLASTDFEAAGGSVDVAAAMTFAELATDDGARAALLLRRWRLLAAMKVFRYRQAIHALASELEHRGALTGGEVEALLAAGGHLRRRAVDPDKVVVGIGKRRVSLRQWAREVDRAGGNRFAIATKEN